MTDNIKNALTRKFGPLPAWTWLLLLAVGVYYYRNKLSNTASGTGTGSVAPAPNPNPQPIQTLEPGESAYDPNTGMLTTAPGGGSSGSVSDQSFEDLAGAIQAAINAATANGSGGSSGGGTDTNGDQSAPSTPAGATPAAAAPKVGSPAGPHGAVHAPSGSRKPTAPPGFRTVGTGKGNWIFVPTRTKSTVKPKAGKSIGIRATGSTVSRSGSTIRTSNGGRRSSVSPQVGKPAGQTRRINRALTALGRARQRPTTPVVHHAAPVQHPVATHPAPRPRQSGAPAPRPSAPPPRPIRTSAPKPPPPKPVRRRAR